MAKKLTEGIHVGLLKHLDIGQGMDSVTWAKWRRFNWCRKWGWTPEEYDRQDAITLMEFDAFIATERKLAEMRKQNGQ